MQTPIYRWRQGPAHELPAKATGEPPITRLLNPSPLGLEVLVQICLIENERCCYGQQHDTRFAYELFRRAIVECNAAAWEALRRQYGALVQGWIQRGHGTEHSALDSAALAEAAFDRFQATMTPQRFALFPDAVALLRYLQVCVGGAVVQASRAQAVAALEQAAQAGYLPMSVVAPGRDASRETVWEYLMTQVHAESERVVVVGTFIMGMSPADIAQHHPDLFANPGAVAALKRDLLARLSHDLEMCPRLIVPPPPAEEMLLEREAQM